MPAAARARRSAYTPPGEVECVLPYQVLGPFSEVEMVNAPDLLYLAGDQSLLRGTKRVAIVGSRSASEAGKKRAGQLARALAREGVVVVSGLAAGIDKAAHDGALRGGGRTIAVIGTPVDRAYPAANAALQESIYQRHLLVSQFAPGQRTFPSDFVKRNRTMALICHASVIVEAGETSGTLSQAREMTRLGRPLFFMQSLLDNPDLEWPHRFQKTGARVLGNVRQLLEAIET